MGVGLSRFRRGRQAAYVVTGLLIAAAVAGCGSRSDGARSSASEPVSVPTPSAARQHDAKAVAAALRKHGALIAGTIWSKAVVSVDECDPPVDKGGLIECWLGQGVGGEDPFEFRVRLQADGTVSKVLGSAEPAPGGKSSAQTASLLAADDHLQHAPSRTRRYRCKPSPRLTPRGNLEGTGATGQLCSTYQRVSRRTISRYVEFAPDGTSIRDYVLDNGEASGS